MLNLDEKTKAQEKIIDELFENILKKQPNGPAYFSSYLFKKLEEIFKLEVTYLGYRYSKKKARNNNIAFETKRRIDDITLGQFKYKDVVPSIVLYTEHENYFQIFSSDPKRRVEALGQFLNTLFHELRHLKQYMLTQENISNKNVLRNAKEFLIVTSKKENLIKLYKENHNDFAIEADAKIKANNKLKSLLTTDYLKVDENFNMTIYETKRDYNDIVVDDVVYNRDALISEIIDFQLQKNKDTYFKEMPILTKEYNPDGTKIKIGELIRTMKTELDVAKFIKDEDSRNQIRTDIKELYYELIYNRLEENDQFELYEAINSRSKDEIISLIEEIKEYFNTEKKRTLKLLRKKCDAELSKYNTHKYGRFPLFNDGKVKINTLNNIELVNTDDYVKKLTNDDNNQVLDILYNSKAFKSRIPNYGTYVLKNNSKISVNAFVHNIFLKEYNDFPKDKKGNIPLRFCQILNYYVKTPYEIDYLYKCEKVNRASQIHQKVLNDVLDLPLFNNDEIIIDDYLYSYLLIVKDLDKPDVINEVRNYMLYEIVNDGDDIYYSFNEDQLIYFDMLSKAAKYLSVNNVLNPNKINYYKIFKNSDIINEISIEIKRYNDLNNKSLKL